jgi:uridine kinase
MLHQSYLEYEKQFLEFQATKFQCTITERQVLIERMSLHNDAKSNEALVENLNLAKNSPSVVLNKRVYPQAKEFGFNGENEWKELRAWLRSDVFTKWISSVTNKKIIIGISGGSCSGKTWLAHKFKEICPIDVCIFGLDGYYKDSDYVNTLEHTHDDPASVDLVQIGWDLGILKAGGTPLVPNYDYVAQKRVGMKPCVPAPIIIVEGIFAFSHPSILNKLDFKVWIDTDSDIRYERRLIRDTGKAGSETDRGREPEKVKEKWNLHVQPGYEKHLLYNRRYADIIIPNYNDDGIIPEGLYSLLAYCLYADTIKAKFE